MTKKPATTSPAAGPPAPGETEEQRFARILIRKEFTPLKAVLDNLQLAITLMNAALITTKQLRVL